MEIAFFTLRLKSVYYSINMFMSYDQNEFISIAPQVIKFIRKLQIKWKKQN